MKKLLLAVISANLFLSCNFDDYSMNKRHGVKGLNEAMAENGAPRDFGSRGFITWENGKVTDLNGNERFDFSSYDIVTLCNGEEYSPNPELYRVWTNPETTPVYNFEGRKILDKAVSEKAVKQVQEGLIDRYDTSFQLYNKILVIKESLLDYEELFGVYTVDGKEIVPLGTSWEDTYTKLITYKGSEEIKKNINLLLKFGTDTRYEEEYYLDVTRGYIREDVNGHFNVVDIAKGGYIATNLEDRSIANSIIHSDWFENYYIFNQNLSSKEYDQKFKLLQKLMQEYAEQKGYGDIDLMYNSFLCCTLNSGQDHMVDLNGNVVLVADRIHENRGYNPSNVIFVENNDGNNFFISYDENPMNDKYIPGPQYREYFDISSLPEIPKAVRDAIQIPTFK